MKNFFITLLFGFIIFSLSSCVKKNDPFKIPAMNVWQETTMVDGGFEALVDEPIRIDADMVAFSEIRNYNQPFLFLF